MSYLFLIHRADALLSSAVVATTCVQLGQCFGIRESKVIATLRRFQFRARLWLSRAKVDGGTEIAFKNDQLWLTQARVSLWREIGSWDCVNSISGSRIWEASHVLSSPVL